MIQIKSIFCIFGSFAIFGFFGTLRNSRFSFIKTCAIKNSQPNTWTHKYLATFKIKNDRFRKVPKNP